MKKAVLLIVFLVFASTACLALDTGDASLDLHLRNVNAKTATPAGAKEVRTELVQKYSVTERQLKFLSKQGYTLAEIQYLALLAKQSGKSIENVAALHSKGVGWGVLAIRLGVQPSALRKLIVQERKAEKTGIQEKEKVKIESRKQVKETTGTERMERGPKGTGRGKSR